jgi:hypothetical protein
MYAEDAELARLRADVEGLRGHMEQMRKALEAERRHSATVEADNASWMEVARRYVLSADLDTRLLAWGALSDLTGHPHPGAAILAVVDAAGEAVRTQTTEAYAKLGWAVAAWEKGHG